MTLDEIVAEATRRYQNLADAIRYIEAGREETDNPSDFAELRGFACVNEAITRHPQFPELARAYVGWLDRERRRLENDEEDAEDLQKLARDLRAVLERTFAED